MKKLLLIIFFIGIETDFYTFNSKFELKSIFIDWEQMEWL